MHVRAPASNTNNLVPTNTHDVQHSVRDRIITPYDSTSFHSLLTQFQLISRYPNLVSKLEQGFPLGDFPPILSTYTPPNHPSVLAYHDVVSKYLLAEREKERMSGPYTRIQLEETLGSPFRSSPVVIVLKQAKPRMAINLSFKGRAGFAVNDMIDSDDFPTRWGGATEVENIVSQRFLCLSITFGFLARFGIWLSTPFERVGYFHTPGVFSHRRPFGQACWVVATVARTFSFNIFKHKHVHFLISP